MCFVFADLERTFDQVQKVEILKSLWRHWHFHNGFLIQVRLHKGSVLKLLILIMVLEALSKEITSGYPVELLYADEFPVVTESHEGPKGRLETWKSAMELKRVETKC